MNCTARLKFRFESDVARTFSMVDEIVMCAAVSMMENTLIMLSANLNLQ